MGNIQTTGPNEALIVSGGCCRPAKKQIIVGGWCWKTWMLTNIQVLSLEVMTLNPKCEHVQSCHGVPVTVSGVVHCKIMSNPEFLPLAAEQFLGKSIDNIKSVILHTVEGHTRAVIGTQTIEDICKKRQDLASMIRNATTNDLNRMGIDIMSLTIKDIKDDVEYLNSAGKKSTAIVKKDAAVSAAKAEKEAALVEAEYENKKREKELEMKTVISQQEHSKKMGEVELYEDVGKIQAEANKAYPLMMATLQKDIRKKQMEVETKKLNGLIEIEKVENDIRTTQFEIDMKLPTASEIFVMNQQAEANEKKTTCLVEAEEFRIKEEGKAQAEAIKIEGTAEAKGMKLVAEARREFNEAAVLYEVLKVLPDIAAEIASPLTKFDEIVLLSDGANDKTSTDQSGKVFNNKLISSFATEAAKLSSSVPVAVKAVGGSDKLTGSILNSIMQLQKSRS